MRSSPLHEPQRLVGSSRQIARTGRPRALVWVRSIGGRRARAVSWRRSRRRRGARSGVPPAQMPCWSSPLPRREGSWRRATGRSRMSMVKPGAMRIGGGRSARRTAAQAAWRRAKSRTASGWVPGGAQSSATPSAGRIRSARRRARGGGAEDDAVGEERVHPGRSGGAELCSREGGVRGTGGPGRCSQGRGRCGRGGRAGRRRSRRRCRGRAWRGRRRRPRRRVRAGRGPERSGRGGRRR